jgi:hypothetical protein
VLGGIGVARHRKLTGMAPMADGGGLVLTRLKKGGAFMASSRRLRWSLGHHVETSLGVGRSMAGVRRRGGNMQVADGQ